METTIPDYPRDVTFEKVWAAIQETDKQQKETARLIRELREESKETYRRMQEIAERPKERDRLFKEQSENWYAQIGRLTDLFGDLTVSMVVPSLCEKFKEFGLFFPKASPNVIYNDKINDISFEVDIMLENGDKRAFLGAVACFVVTDELKQLILNEGMYFIEYTGENFFITQPDGKAREW